MMLQELGAVLANVPQRSGAADYHEAILQHNILGKATDTTRQKSLRHLRELYALDEAIPIFGLLRSLHAMDAASLPLLAVQVAWARDPLLRATTPPVIDALEGERVETASLAHGLEAVFPHQYSELNQNKIARNAASSWTQSGHLAGRAKKLHSVQSCSGSIQNTDAETRLPTVREARRFIRSPSGHRAASWLAKAEIARPSHLHRQQWKARSILWRLRRSPKIGMASSSACSSRKWRSDFCRVVSVALPRMLCWRIASW